MESRNNPVIVSENVGTIEYERAEILLKPINITNTVKRVQEIPIIEVSGSPKSNDVIGLQDLYLQLDINNSTVDMVSDSVVAGESSSGTNYTATSSYVQGDIARLTDTETLNTTLTTSDTYTLGSYNIAPL